MKQLWKLEGHAATLLAGRFEASLDPRDPSRGLHAVKVDAQLLDAARCLGVNLTPAAASHAQAEPEVYVRGCDLIGTYAERPAHDMRTQIYWRAGTHPLAGEIAAIELVVSVQTSLLDSHPSLTIASEAAASEVLRLVDSAQPTFAKATDETHHTARPHCYLLRLAGGQFSYAQMVHPSDAHTSRLGGPPDGASAVQLSHELFADRLEKGVILRARVLGVLLERANDESAAAAHWHAFLKSELPLTT